MIRDRRERKDGVRMTMNGIRRTILLSFVLILIGEPSLSAQNHYTISQFAHESVALLKQPAKWHGSDWLKLGLVTAGSALAMSVDEPVRDAALRDHRRSYRSAPIEIGKVWGDWYTPPIIAGAFGLHGWLAHNASSSKIGFETVQAVVYAEFITQTLKVAFGRARPYENKGAFSFQPFTISDIGFHSLPGGHNTSGWAISTVLAHNTHSIPLKILAYAPAGLTFASRIYQDQHWTSDCVLGAAIGFVVGSWVVNLHEKNESTVSVSAIHPLTVSIRF